MKVPDSVPQAVSLLLKKGSAPASHPGQLCLPPHRGHCAEDLTLSGSCRRPSAQDIWAWALAQRQGVEGLVGDRTLGKRWMLGREGGQSTGGLQARTPAGAGSRADVRADTKDDHGAPHAALWEPPAWPQPEMLGHSFMYPVSAQNEEPRTSRVH